jgi:hypothetical protein
MTRPILLAYQLLIGLSDTTTGVLLLVAPKFALQLMYLHSTSDALPFLSFIGAFVLSVGLACLYGAFLTPRAKSRAKLEMIWLLTALTRASVAVFVVEQVLAGAFEAAWLTVAFSDGVCVVIQAVGLRKGWLVNAAQ